MNEYLYHLTGLCGEHWHPNFINVTFLAMTAILCYRAAAKYVDR